jgi:hypothetical protein
LFEFYVCFLLRGLGGIYAYVCVGSFVWGSGAEGRKRERRGGGVALSFYLVSTFFLLLIGFFQWKGRIAI